MLKALCGTFLAQGKACQPAHNGSQSGIVRKPKGQMTGQQGFAQQGKGDFPRLCRINCCDQIGVGGCIARMNEQWRGEAACYQCDNTGSGNLPQIGCGRTNDDNQPDKKGQGPQCHQQHGGQWVLQGAVERCGIVAQAVEQLVANGVAESGDTKRHHTRHDLLQRHTVQ